MIRRAGWSHAKGQGKPAHVIDLLTGPTINLGNRENWGMTTIDELDAASDHMMLVSRKMADDMITNLLMNPPWPEAEYVPPTRWQRIKRVPRRAKVAILGVIHDRFFRDYCDCDY